MNRKKIYEASNIIWDAIKNENNINSLPKKLIPKSKKEAYEIQKAHKFFTDYEHVGYKIAATSIEGQKHINVSGPIMGMLFKHNLYYNNETINFINYTMGVAEPEIAFKLSKNISSNLKEIKEIKRCIDYVIPAIELPDTRFNHFESAGEFQLIADNACAKYLFLGSPYSIIDNINFENHFVNISAINSINEGNTVNVLGSPIKALFWAVNELITYSLPIKKNMIITTGTCTIPIKFQDKDKLDAYFGVIGKVKANINL